MIDHEELSIALHLLAREAARRNPVEVRETASGAFDVVLRLDGGYRDSADAQRVADMLTQALVVSAASPAIVPFSELRDLDHGPGAGLIDVLAAIQPEADQ